jgi:hypothetical protein
MNFEEAIHLKQKFGKTHPISEDIYGTVIVAPANYEDLLKYVNDFRFSKFDDNSAKKYSSDSQFKIYALWTDGINVLKKELNSPL